MDVQDWADLAHFFTADICAGIGLLGNEDEERELVKKCVAMDEEELEEAEEDDVKDDVPDELGDVSMEGIEEDDEEDSEDDEADDKEGEEEDEDMNDAEMEAVDSKPGDEVSLHPYKPAKRHRDGDSPSEEDLGDYETFDFGNDYVEANGNHIHVTDYFGSEWVKFIEALYNTPPLDCPGNMRVRPHDYQLKGAAQINYLCESRFRGALVGDGMGIGKTLQAILAMWLQRDKPGFSMVIAPKSVCLQWVDEISGAWDEGYGLRPYHLQDSSMTAHQILRGGWDVLVCSYEFVEASSKKARNFPDELTKYNNRGRVGERPKRPNAGISSGFWRQLGIPIKRLILDEVQVVNKRSGVRHKAIMKLPAKAIVGLCGTLPHNRWHDMSGYFDFLKSHPFKSHADFMATFASQDAYGKSVRPDAARLRLLQRCLQAVIIARPSSVLKLPPCRRNLVIFDLLPATRKKVDEYTTKYLQMTVMSAETGGPDFGEKNESYALAYAVIAQLWSLHPLLGSTVEEARNRKVELAQTGEGEVSPGTQFEAEDQEARNGEARLLWLQKVEDYDQLVNSSMRLLSIVSTINQIREASPKAKIVVFSQYLKFLDILDVALRRDVGVRTIRFDGTVHPLTRRRRLEEFAEEKEGVVLLITAGAGGVGLNITETSVVLICEEWWNGNAERQCICRVWRQGRDEGTLVVNFHGTNSAICGVISSGRKAKDRINKELMGPLVRGHNEPPVILELLHQRGLPPQKFEELDVLMTEGF